MATAETEAAWIESARGLRVREVERLVSGRARGDPPSTPPRPKLEEHVLRFEVSSETLAAFHDAPSASTKHAARSSTTTARSSSSRAALS